MEMNVHNMKEATALVKEWNRSGHLAGVSEITFLKHETEEYIGRVYWANDYKGFVWSE